MKVSEAEDKNPWSKLPFLFFLESVIIESDVMKILKSSRHKDPNDVTAARFLVLFLLLAGEKKTPKTGWLLLITKREFFHLLYWKLKFAKTCIGEWKDTGSICICVSFNFQKYQTPQNDARKKKCLDPKSFRTKNTDTLHTCILPTDLSTFLLTFYQHST